MEGTRGRPTRRYFASDHQISSDEARELHKAAVIAGTVTPELLRKLLVIAGLVAA